jgi:HEAT repeat protein
MTIETLRRTWTSEKLNTMTGAFAAFGFLLLLLSSLRDPSTYLMTCLGMNEVREMRALVAMQRLGISAGGRVTELDQLQRTLPQPRRLAIIETLGYLGPTSLEPLGNALADPDPEIAAVAARILSRSGSAAAPLLADRGLVAADNRIREQARQALRSLGSDGLQVLVDTLTNENAPARLPLLSELNPAWDLLTSSNPVFQQVAAHHGAVRVLGDPRSTPEEVSAMIGQLEDQAAAIVPLVWSHVVHAEPAQRSTLIQLLIKWKSATTTFVVERLNNGSAPEQEIAAAVLQQMGPDAAPHLVELLGAKQARAAQLAAAALGNQGRTLAPLLAQALRHQNSAVSEKAASLLAGMGPDAVPPVSSFLADADEGVRARAAGIFRSIGAAGADQFVLLVAQAEPEVSQSAFKLLASISPDSLLFAYQSHNTNRLRQAHEALSRGERERAEQLLAEIPLPARTWAWRHLMAQVRNQAPLRIDVSDLPITAQPRFAPAEHELYWLKPRSKLPPGQKAPKGPRFQSTIVVGWSLATGERLDADNDWDCVAYFLLEKEVRRIEHSGYDALQKSLAFASGGRHAVSFFPDPEYLIATSRGCEVYNDNGTKLASIEHRAERLAFDPLSGRVALITDTEVKVLERELRLWRQLAVPQGLLESSVGRTLSIVPGGRCLLLLDDRTVRRKAHLVCMEKKEVRALAENDLGDFAISPTGDVVVFVVGGSRTRLGCFDASSGDLLFTWEVGDRVSNLSFSPSGEQLLLRTERNLIVSAPRVTRQVGPQHLPKLDVLSELFTRWHATEALQRRIVEQSILELGAAVLPSVLSHYVAAENSIADQLEPLVSTLAQRHCTSFGLWLAESPQERTRVAERLLLRFQPAVRNELFDLLISLDSTAWDLAGGLILLVPDPPRERLEQLAEADDNERSRWATTLLSKLPTVQ